MLRDPCSSCLISPASKANPRFQQVDPGLIAPDIRNMWLMVSNAWVPPPRRTATTAAPIFLRNKPPLARATNPARSSSAFISALTSVKYVGEPRMIASASTMRRMHSLKTSFFCPQRAFFALKHW
jgi:hypothetical protein